jgi:hypothetical protein
VSFGFPKFVYLGPQYETNFGTGALAFASITPDPEAGHQK